MSRGTSSSRRLAQWHMVRQTQLHFLSRKERFCNSFLFIAGICNFLLQKQAFNDVWCTPLIWCHPCFMVNIFNLKGYWTCVFVDEYLTTIHLYKVKLKLHFGPQWNTQVIQWMKEWPQWTTTSGSTSKLGLGSSYSDAEGRAQMSRCLSKIIRGLLGILNHTPWQNSLQNTKKLSNDAATTN